MKAWRRTLASWPKESAQPADRSSLPKWIDPAARQKDVRAETFVAAMAGLSACVLPLLATMGAAQALGFSDGGAFALCMFGVGIVGMIAMAGLVARHGEAWSARRLARRTMDRLEARHEATLGAEAVGVTYADGRWRVDLVSDAWDWGALKFDFDRLVFVGEHSRFDFGPADILDTEIRKCDSAFGGPRPRLYVGYLYEGRPQSIGIDLPYTPSARSRTEAIQELREKVERWRMEVFPATLRNPLFPDAANAPQPRLSEYCRIGRPAKIVAGVATLGLLIVCHVAIIFATASFGYRGVGAYLGGLNILWTVAWFMLAAKIERRMPLRWRHPSAAVLPPTSEPQNVSIQEEPKAALRA